MQKNYNEIQRKDSEIQRNYNEIQRKDDEIQRKNIEIQHLTTALHDKDVTLETLRADMAELNGKVYAAISDSKYALFDPLIYDANC